MISTVTDCRTTPVTSTPELIRSSSRRCRAHPRAISRSVSTRSLFLTTKRRWLRWVVCRETLTKTVSRTCSPITGDGLQSRSSNKTAPHSTPSYTRSEVVPGGARWYTNAATLADIDGDGHTDLIIGNFFADGARILDARAEVGDEMQDSMSRAQNGGRKHLLLWKAPAAGTSVQFEEVRGALDEQSAQGWALAIGAADLDGDLLPEIYFANDFGPDRLLHNRSTPGHPRFELLEGRRSFTTTKSKVLGHDSYKGMGVDFGDLNGDGLPDIYVSNITQEYGLEESHFVFLSTGHTELI